MPCDGTDVDCVQTGEVIQAEMYDCKFGHSMNNMKEYDRTSLFGVKLPIQLVTNLSY